MAKDEFKNQEATNIISAEESYLSLINKITSITLIIQNEKIVFINDPALRKTGYTQNEFIGKSFFDFILPEEQDRLKLFYEKSVKQEASQERYETIGVTKNGTTIYIEVAVNSFEFKGKEAILVLIQDISKRKIAEQQLKESEQMFRNLVENQGEGIGISDMDDKFIFANPAAHRIFGVEEGELIGRSLFDFLSEEGKKTIEEQNKIRKTGKNTSYELLILQPSGKTVNLLITATAQFNQQGNQISTLGIFRDITERHLAQTKINESKQLLESVIFGANVGIWEWDFLTGNITYNERFAAIIGYTSAEFGDFNIHKGLHIIHSDDKAETAKSVKKLFQGIIRQVDIQFRLKTKNNDWKWVQVRGKVTKYTLDNKVAKVSGTITDITELKLSRMELENRIKMEKMITEITSDLVNILNHDFNSVINNSLKKLGLFMGIDRAYIFLLKNKNNIVENAYEWCSNHVTPGIERYQSVSVSGFRWWFNNLRKSDHIQINNINHLPDAALQEKKILEERETVSLLALPLRYENQLLGFIGFDCISEKIWSNRDINTLNGIAINISNALNIREHHEQLVIAKNKAEESDRLKTAFLATMNHELRTPLNHIIGISEIITATSADSDIIEFSNIINESGNHLLTLIEDIFSLADIDKGLVSIRNKTVKGLDIFMENKSDLERILKKAGKEGNIALRFQPNRTTLMRDITTDKVKISQILHKLFNNAVKYTQQGEIEFSFAENSRHDLEFTVRDSGIGIAKEKQKIIFDFFRQVDDTNTRKYGGVGIGLAITKKIIDLMAGSISVESESNIGSTFTVTIPVSQNAISIE